MAYKITFMPRFQRFQTPFQMKPKIQLERPLAGAAHFFRSKYIPNAGRFRPFRGYSKSLGNPVFPRLCGWSE